MLPFEGANNFGMAAVQFPKYWSLCIIRCTVMLGGTCVFVCFF